ncbi:MFS transporter [Ruegeria sp. HKCCC2117]|uniref:MFS transporter n=2 Tax=unclassified Ruegeria TaxID=2625375 RepID=UPI001A084418|nr:MFS transporter [Ruegeria sp. HKCCD4332]NOD86740.1 MFS transporter [Ruegeria sp. HKCCD4318]NOE12295.1 MFS transporter [Ruegeria sp. HKCCD4318-2]
MISLGAAWRAVAAMFILNGALFGIWASRIPAVRDRLGLSHEELGYGLLFMAAGAVCSFPITGRLTDRFGAVAITRVIAVLYTLSLILLAIAGGFWGLAVFLFIFGAFHGSMDVAMNAWAAEVEQAYDKPVMSSFHAMWSLGAGLGALSGYAAVQMGLSVLAHFLTAGGIVVGFALTLSWVHWTSKRSEGEQGSVFALPSGILVLVGFTALCGALGEGAVADWSAIYLRDITNATESVAALGYAVFSVTMVAFRLAGAFVITRFGPVATARFGGLCAALGVFGVVSAVAPELALAGFALMGVGYAVIMPLAFSRAASDLDVPPGQAIASVATLGYGGLLIGPPLIGFLAELFGLRLAFSVLLPLAVLIIVLAGALRRAD